MYFYCARCNDDVRPALCVDGEATIYCMSCGQKHTITVKSSGCKTCKHNEYDHPEGCECEVMDCECRKFEKNV